MVVEHLRKIIPASMKRAATDHRLWLRWRLNVLARPLYAGMGSILAFHRVCEKEGRPRLGLNADLEVTPTLLEQTINFCKRRGFVFLSLDELHAGIRKGGPGSRFVVFTIDDGYADTFKQAYPIFKQHNVPFTVYITTCFPNRTAILWWYILEDLLFANSEIQVELEGTAKAIPCSTLAQKQSAFEALAGYFMHAHDEADWKKILKQYQGDWYTYVEQLAMSWGQVRKLSEDPLVTIGAHSTRHLSLASLTADEALHEAVNSKREIENQIGKPVEHFAYPYGGRRAAGHRDFAIIKEAGFKTATTTRNGNVFASHAEHENCLPRIPIHAGALEEDIDYLSLWTDGLVPCHENGFQRVVTI